MKAETVRVPCDAHMVWLVHSRPGQKGTYHQLKVDSLSAGDAEVAGAEYSPGEPCSAMMEGLHQAPAYWS